MKFVDSDLGRVVEFSGCDPEFTKHGLTLRDDPAAGTEDPRYSSAMSGKFRLGSDNPAGNCSPVTRGFVYAIASRFPASILRTVSIAL